MSKPTPTIPINARIPRALCAELEREKRRTGRAKERIHATALAHFLALPENERDRIASGGPKMED